MNGTTVSISSDRAGYCEDALKRILALSDEYEREIVWTKLYDNVYLGTNTKNSRYHQVIIKSEYSFEEIERILDPINFPHYNYYATLNIVNISIH